MLQQQGCAGSCRRQSGSGLGEEARTKGEWSTVTSAQRNQVVMRTMYESMSNC